MSNQTHTLLRMRANARKWHVPPLYSGRQSFLVAVFFAGLGACVALGSNWLFERLSYAGPGQVVCASRIPASLIDITDPGVCESRAHCELVVYASLQREQLEALCPPVPEQPFGPSPAVLEVTAEVGPASP